MQVAPVLTMSMANKVIINFNKKPSHYKEAGYPVLKSCCKKIEPRTHSGNLQQYYN